MNDLSSQEFYLARKAEFARRSAIPLIGLAMVLTAGVAVFKGLQGLSDLSSAAPLTCFSNCTLYRGTGRYTNLLVRDQSGRSLEACELTDCTYQGWGSDAGSVAKLCFSGRTLANVEIDGGQRLTREQQLSFLGNRVWVGAGILAVGMLCLGISAYNERRALTSFLLRRSSRYL